MNAIEIYENMASIVIRRKEACAEKIAALPPSSRTEKRALLIEQGMYRFCLNAGFLFNCSGTIEKVLIPRKRVMGNILSSHRYPALEKAFTSANEEEALTLYAAFQAEIFIRDQIMKTYYKNLEDAKASGDADGAFEAGIKIAVLEDVFKDFEKFRKDNNIYTGIMTKDLKELSENGK